MTEKEKKSYHKERIINKSYLICFTIKDNRLDLLDNCDLGTIQRHRGTL